MLMTMIRMTEALILILMSVTVMAGDTIPGGLIIRGILHGTVHIGIVPTGAGALAEAVFMAAGIRPGMTGIGARLTAGAGDTVITEAIMAIITAITDIIIITPPTIATNTDAPQQAVPVRAGVMQATIVLPARVRLSRRPVHVQAYRLQAGVHPCVRKVEVPPFGALIAIPDVARL